MRNDLRYALRSLRRAPVFTVVAILSLALGIGANTAIFSLLDQALLRSLPVREPRRLVVLHAPKLQLQGTSSSSNHETVYSLAMWREYARRTDLFEGVLFRGGLPPVVLQSASSDYVSVELVSGNYFDVLGVRAMLGRTFTAAEDNGQALTVLSHKAWVERFGADASIVGRTVRLSGLSYIVLGVLPPRFDGVVTGGRNAFYVPASMQRQLFPDMDGTRPDVRWVNIIARLKSGVTRQRAEEAVQSTWKAILDERLAAHKTDDAEDYRRMRLQLIEAPRGIDSLRRQLETPLIVLMSTAGFVLLIACVNLAGLLMARAAAKQRDTAIRLSFGASRGRIVRQLLLESFLLSLSGAVLGLILARWITAGLLALTGSADGPLTWQTDERVLLFAFAVAVLTALIFGSIPAWQTFAADIASTLKAQASSVASSHAKVRKVLVAAQVALATLLLFGAGLFARSLSNLMKVDPGFRTEGVMSFLISPRQAGYDLRRGNQLYADILARLRTLPGVTAAGGSKPGPMTGSESSGNVTVQGYEPSPKEEVGASWHAASPGWFATLGIPLLAGRDFTEADGADAPQVAIVNAEFARKYCNGNCIGKKMASGRGNNLQWKDIVGVAGNVHHSDLRTPPKTTVFVPFWQDNTLGRMSFYVRTAGDETRLAGAVREVVRSLDPNLPVHELKPLRKEIEEAMAADRTLAILCTAFGLIAVLLTAIGIYGVIAWTVARRTNEIAVRMALGALPTRVLGLVLREVMILAGAGLAAGAAMALASGRVVEANLFGVAGRDAAMLMVAVVCTGAMALLAALVPAVRATRIDPSRALRFE